MILARLFRQICYSLLILLLALIALMMKADHGVARANAAAKPNEPMSTLHGKSVLNPGWSLTGNLVTARRNHTATLLHNGKVLVAGGVTISSTVKSAELFDPATGMWSTTSNLNTVHYFHTATLLPSGKVLIVGGSAGVNSAELYDPTTGLWSSTGSLSTGRGFHTATLLSNGKVLVVGGEGPGESRQNSAELYDPATGNWSATGSLTTARLSHTATLLPNGKVLVAGGIDTNGFLHSAELYDSATGNWSVTGSLTTARLSHTATLLPNGKVLVAGGEAESTNGYLNSAELYNPATETWATTESLFIARDQHTATLLPNGKVLVSGGFGGNGYQNVGELYDPTTETWSFAVNLNLIVARYNQTATLLPNGKVLVAGGYDVHPLNSAELYDSASATWHSTGDLGTAREGSTATLLPSGKVLVAGGNDNSGRSNIVELYDPTLGTWSTTGSLNTGRISHTATLLPSGKVLVVGGIGNGGTSSLSTTELYDPVSGTWSYAGSVGVSVLAGHSATLLPSGKVLLAGGHLRTSISSSAELYDPVLRTWSMTGNLTTARSSHTATLLPSGSVLVVGGANVNNEFSAELYNPSNGTWSTTGHLTSMPSSHTATLLPSGFVLVAAGGNAELYNPSSGTWSTTGNLITWRNRHVAMLLPSGKVLIVGGINSSFLALSSAEVYDPSSGIWNEAGTLAIARNYHTATLLPSGKVLVASGSNGSGKLTSAELYDAGTDFQADWRPVLSSATSPVLNNTSLIAAGSQFKGISETSGGNGSQNSSSNYPLVQLISLTNEQSIFLPVSAMAEWSNTSFTSTPITVMTMSAAGFPPGFAMMTVFTNGIPSLSQIIQVGNNSPTITVATTSAAQGSPASLQQIATVNDADQVANTLTVTVTPLTGSGVTVGTPSINAAGQVTASIQASCTATDSTFMVKVTDNMNAMMTATLNVTVTANTAPTLSYAAAMVTAGNATSNSPTTAMDNGSITGYSIVSVVPALTAAPTVNSSGVVSISNAGPSGNHTITMQATDNCGATTNASFTLTVNVSIPTLGNYPNATVITGGNTTVTPAAAPINAASITAATSTNFKGTFAVNPTTGVVAVTDAHVAGSYSVTVTAFSSDGGSTTKTFAMAVTNGANCSSSSFGFSQPAGSPIGAGNTPFTVAVGDFNGDGKQDIAVANQDSRNITILLGNGSGGFSAAAGSPGDFGGNPVSVAVGDFNGDSRQDLAVVISSSANVLILLGNGSGGFSPAAGSPIGVGNNPLTVAVGDFNNDGKQDLAVANHGSNNVTILLGNGSGGFNPAAGSPLGVGSGPASVAVGDFNSDGKQDLAVTNSNTASMTILLGSGNGGFIPAAGSPVGTGSQPRSVEVGDFNGDGKQDLATANQSSANVTVLLGNGSGGFSPATGSPVAAGTDPVTVAVGDFDGDGKQDLVVANNQSNNVTILLGTGSGGFSTAAGSPVGVSGHLFPVAVGDFNTDGKQDLALATYNSDSVTILLNNCAPTIMADAALARRQGSPAGPAVSIATISDAEDMAGSLTVAVIAGGTATGITLGSITITSGSITATVAADCTATSGTVRLQVTDSAGLKATNDLQVNVTPNTAPTLIYGTTSVSAGSLTSNSPTTATDNGSITGYAVQSAGTYTGTISVNTSGVVSISNAVPVGMHTITIRATDDCGVTTDASFTLTVNNNLPMIVASEALTRQQGSTGSVSTIATVSDTETAVGSLTVTATTVPAGITVTLITNTAGTITATVVADCTATLGANTVVLMVTDGNSGTATANLIVPVMANTAPTLTYAATLVSAGNATTNSPATATDNGSIAGYSIVSVVPALMIVPTVNASGVVSITNAGPSGDHTITVQATDNCGATTNASFMLTVNCQSITINPASLPNGFQGTAYNQTLMATGGGTSYSFAVTTGTLPGGLNLTSDGELTGTPTTAGTYNFTVTATDNNGCTGTRTYSLGLSGDGLQFYPLAHPVRLLDTRPVASGCDAPGVMIAGGTSRTQTAAGRTCDGLTIPANAKALTGNITTVESGGGFLTLYPSDITRPLVANSNFAANQVLNNVFTVGLGAVDGAFNIFVTTDTNVVVDITGYYAPPSGSGLYFHPLPHPVRLLDTRAGQPACFMPGALLTAGSTMTQLGTTTCDGVLIPAGAQALVGNATTVGPQANGFLTLFPADASRPLAASSNYQSGINMNAPFIVGLSPSGQFNIYTVAATNLVVDVLGYYSTQLNDVNGQGLLFNPLPTPVRLLDTRAGQPGCFTPGAQMIGGTAYLQPATGVCTGIPATAKAVVGNATTVNVVANGFLTFWPSDANQPFVAASNYRSSTVFNRHFTVGLGVDGAFKRFASSTTDLVIDLSGYFAP